MTRIGFIGLGNMGGPMAANLARAGHTVQVFDLVAESLTRAIEAGCIAAGDAREAVSGCELVISMLPAGEHVRSLWLGESAGERGGQDLLAALPHGALVIDCSTIDVASARQVGAAAQARGIRFLDAPVSGGVAGAAAGTLTFIVGGEQADFEAAKPVLACMGQNLFHAGALGAGQIAKMCNNMLLAIHMAGTAEALALGVKEGLDPGVLSTIMGKSSGNNWSLERYNPWPGVMENVPASRNYQGGLHDPVDGQRLRIGHGPGRACPQRRADGGAGAQPVQPARHQGAGGPGFFQHRRTLSGQDRAGLRAAIYLFTR